MKIQHSTRHGYIIVALTGRIDRSSVAQVQRTLRKHLSGQPSALICDLAGVRYLDPVVATVFSTVANHPATRWPTTNLPLCRARPQVAQTLRRVQASHLVPLYDSVETAMDAARTRPTHLRDELRLAPTPTAAATARAFVREVGQAWQLARPDETLVERAVLVANELVTNAVVHARTDLWLQLELRGDRLFISVRDRGPRLLRPVTPNLDAEGGRGLWLVEQLTRAWGVRPHPDDGKGERARFRPAVGQAGPAGPGGGADPAGQAAVVAAGRRTGQAVSAGRAGRVRQDDPARPVAGCLGWWPGGLDVGGRGRQ